VDVLAMPLFLRGFHTPVVAFRAYIEPKQIANGSSPPCRFAHSTVVRYAFKPDFQYMFKYVVLRDNYCIVRCAIACNHSKIHLWDRSRLVPRDQRLRICSCCISMRPILLNPSTHVRAPLPSQPLFVYASTINPLH
jgi:hypothetical protein